MLRSVAVLALLAVTACSSQKSAATAPKQVEQQPPRAPSLLDHVPDDTPFLFAQKGSSYAGAKLHDVLDGVREELAPALAMVDDEMIAAGTPSERLLFVGMRAFMALDADDFARLGFDPARVEVAMYGYGLTPVARLRLDGVYLRSLIDRTLRDANVPDPAVPWGKHHYRTYTFESGMRIIGVVLDDQLVVAMSRRAEQILPHMVGDEAGRPARPFELVTISERYPQLEGTPFAFFDPARTATLIDTGDALRALMPDPSPGCTRAVAGVARTFPGFAGTLVVEDRQTRRSRFVIGPSPTLAKTVGALVRPIPRWPGEPGHGVAHVGIGLAPLPTLEAIADYVDGAFAAAQACGADKPVESMHDALRSIAPMLAPMNGMTIVFHAPPEKDSEAFQFEMYADVTDPYAVYQWMASSLGLPSRAPALGKAVDIPLLNATLVLEAHAIAGTLGGSDPAALDKLRRAPAGPRVVTRFANGTGVADESPDSTMLMDVTIEGDTLVIDAVEHTP